MRIEEFCFWILPREPLDLRAAATWMRDAFEALPLARFGLHPRGVVEKWWRSADDLLLGGGPMLGHTGFVERTEDEGWAIYLSYVEDEARPAVSGAVPVWPLSADGRRSEVWPWLCALLEALVVTADADACFVNGSVDATEDERLPFGAELDAALPAAFTAWNYYGPARLARVEPARLAALPAFVTRPLGEGWLLRPVEDYGDDPAPDLLSAWSDLTGTKATFLRAAPRAKSRAGRRTR